LRKKLEMFVIRVNQMGNLVNSKPCNTCIYYMQLYGIKSVYYSNEDGVIVKEKLNDITADHLSISQNKYYKYIENGGDRYVFDERNEKDKAKIRK
jgi:hypothetical protein